MSKPLEDYFPGEVLIGRFECIAEDCPGQGLYVIENEQDDRRTCTDCCHPMELVSCSSYEISD